MRPSFQATALLVIRLLLSLLPSPSSPLSSFLFLFQFLYLVSSSEPFCETRPLIVILETPLLTSNSYALVGGNLALALNRRSDVDLIIHKLDNYDSSWKDQPNELLWGAEDGSALEGIDRIYADDVITGTADLTIRVTIDFGPPLFPSHNLLILATTEHGYLSHLAITGPETPLSTSWVSKDLVAPSQWAADGFLQSGVPLSSLHVVPHGVSSSFFPLSPEARSSSRDQLGWSSSFVFLHVSSLTSNKNPEILIRAFSKLTSRFSNVKLIIKGNEDLYSSSSRLESSSVSSLYLSLLESNHLHYIGLQTSQAVIALYHQSSDCYLSPYSYEGFNLPVLESMSTGTPVITSSGGSTDDFVTSEYGYKIKTDESRTLKYSKVKSGGVNIPGYPEDEFYEEVEVRELLVDEDDLYEKMSLSSPTGVTLTSDILGSGSYGTVYRGLMGGERGDPREVAVKIIPQEMEGEKVIKARHYMKIERKVNEVLFREGRGGSSPHLVKYWGSIKDGQIEGLVFDVVPSAIPLTDPDILSHLDPPDLLKQLLSLLLPLHDSSLVHRDIKPSNILYSPSTKTLKVIDLGSAASTSISLNPFKPKPLKPHSSKVAISPTFCAPETFIDLRTSPQTFDIFSTSLLYLCIIFKLNSDPSSMSSFRAQLEANSFDLNMWLQEQLKSTVLKREIIEGLETMNSETWKLNCQMLNSSPSKRPTTEDCLLTLSKLTGSNFGGEEVDMLGRGFIRGAGKCRLPVNPKEYRKVVSHFDSSKPLGLVLEEDENGSVMVTKITSKSQADKTGRVKVGDELTRVGGRGIEGYDTAVEFIRECPSRILSLEFVREGGEGGGTTKEEEGGGGGGLGTGKFRSSNQLIGSHSTRGRRQYNEDTVVRKKVRTPSSDFVVGGVFDGHGGSAASQFCEAEFIKRLEEALMEDDKDPVKKLEGTWGDIVETYMETCEGEGCKAEYDSIFGIVKGYLTSSTMSSGTTATIGIFSNDKCHLLNCGDSRACLYSSNGDLKSRTIDHRPDSITEMERLTVEGFPPPVCTAGGNARINVPLKDGTWQYAISRSLEGAPECLKSGIISSPTIHTHVGVQKSDFLVVATDGIWDVFDNETAGLFVANMLSEKILTVDEICERLCGEAKRLGSQDNCSAVILLPDFSVRFNFVANF
ncbi:hypothetical protein TrVE_jg8073 [Triparma verrucosa]|uniref:Uncharacterized protein n=2 Tax=Triparma verrucosa TaxID=1606542 RepID=A0A9W7BEP2_9STRA|nr:hypothetical protein TrVE_jg8073 [Triparma verrucosa]